MTKTGKSRGGEEAAVRGILDQIRELPVSDRARLAVGVVGQLTSVMNDDQMSNLLTELEAAVQQPADAERVREPEQEPRRSYAASARQPGVGQAGRGEFTSGELL